MRPPPFFSLFYFLTHAVRSALRAYRSLRHSLYSRTHTLTHQKKHTLLNSTGGGVGGGGGHTQIPDEICFQARTDGGVRRVCFALRSTHGAVDFGEPYIFFFLLCIFLPVWIPVEEFWGEIINNGLLSVPTFTPVKHFVCVGRSRIPNSSDVSTASETACWLFIKSPE